MLQGSILEHILFLIYVDDMLDADFQCTMVQYADDLVSFLLEGRVENLNDMTKAEDVLVKAKNFIDRNRLLINAINI